MKTNYLISIAFITILFGCSNTKKEHLSPRVHNQEKKVPVVVASLDKKTLKEQYSFTGKLEGITDITLSSEIAGQIIAVHKRLGDRVKKGEVIGAVNNEDTRIELEQARAQVLAAQANLQRMKLQINASEELMKTKSISQAEYIAAKSSYLSAKANHDGALAYEKKLQRTFDNSRFLSPVSGTIASISLEIGEYIIPGKPVCTIIDTRKLIVKSGVSESVIPCMETGSEVSIRTINGTQQTKGTINGIGQKPINGSSSYPIEVVLSNQDGKLFPGMVVTLEVLIKEHKDIVAVDMHSVKTSFGKHYVYIIAPDDEIIEVAVTIGQTIEDQIVLLEHPEIGSAIIVDGLENYNNGMKATIKQKHL